jgi:hypothetical protein
MEGSEVGKGDHRTETVDRLLNNTAYRNVLLRTEELLNFISKKQ